MRSSLYHRHLLRLLATLAVLAPISAGAWWNADYPQRTKISLNTSAAGVETKAAVTGMAIPVRLHSGNFDFLTAKPDGSDLRVVAGDDKTPLKFSIERYDGANELAVLWVQWPVVAPGTDKNDLYVYFGNEKASPDAPAQVFDAATAAAFHFAEADGSATDHTGTVRAVNAVSPEPNAQIGPGARVNGTAIEWPASERVRAAAGAPYSVSLWFRPESATGVVFAQGPLSVSLEGGRLVARLGAVAVAGGEVPNGAWAQAGITLGSGQLTLYVNGMPAAQADLGAAPVAVEGPIRVGQGLAGSVDELQIATALRSPEWMKLSRAAQGADAKLVAAALQSREKAGGEGGGEAGYIGILVKNLTIDAIVVIAILGVMFVIALWVMVAKTILIGRADRANRNFLKRFRAAKQDLLHIGEDKKHVNSPLFRLYQAGVRELRRRNIGVDRSAPPLSGASLDAVKASVDADLVRENHRLNAQMVLLTIAISGGPFLGLLGTVVGVMITFAAIAAAGDVNVNAIAPGIAAALLATVAGLGVAIPALFGYNWLASRIKNVSADMQIFVDEFVTRVAENYGAR